MRNLPRAYSLRAYQATVVGLLAVTSPKRATAAPDVPTLQELGLKDYDATLWIAIAAPAAVPASIVERLNKEIGAVLAEPDVVRALAVQAIDVAPATPDELRDLMRRDFARWRDLGAKTGIRVEQVVAPATAGTEPLMRPERDPRMSIVRWSGAAKLPYGAAPLAGREACRVGW